jgi:hypothetical protein
MPKIAIDVLLWAVLPQSVFERRLSLSGGWHCNGRCIVRMPFRNWERERERDRKREEEIEREREREIERR